MDGEQGLIVLHNYIKEILMTEFKGVKDVQFGRSINCTVDIPCILDEDRSVCGGF
jgi:hypothetical protein